MDLVITNTNRGSIVANRARRASSFLERARGLMFRASIEDGFALIIDPCSSIHMFFMRFPLDVLYVDRDDTIVRIQHGIKPWRIGPLYTKNARYVVELPAGAARRSGCEVGDRLSIDVARTGTDGASAVADGRATSTAQ